MLVTAGFYDPRVFAGEPRRFGYLLKTLSKNVLYYAEVEAGYGGSTMSQIVEQHGRYYVFILDHIIYKDAHAGLWSARNPRGR